MWLTSQDFQICDLHNFFPFYSFATTLYSSCLKNLFPRKQKHWKMCYSSGNKKEVNKWLLYFASQPFLGVTLTHDCAFLIPDSHQILSSKTNIFLSIFFESDNETICSSCSVWLYVWLSVYPSIRLSVESESLIPFSLLFLDASSVLCPSVRPSVCPSVCPSVST